MIAPTMANTADLSRLVDLVQQHRWRLVAVGDPVQLGSVGRGGVFAHWCATLPHHELITPRRFDHPWEAAASLALRSGDAAAAATYAEHQRIHALHPALIAGEVADVATTHFRSGRTVAITTNTAETARAINTEIQRRLDPTMRRPRVRLADGTRACVGDQIATRRNDPTCHTDDGRQVRNRHTWTITATRVDGTVTAAHPERGIVTLPADYVAKYVELGWAVTGYGNQGDTVDIGLAVLEAGTNRNHAYVALTRGRQTNTAWIPDPTGTIGPADQLAAMIAHTADRDSALAVHARLHHEAGLPVPPLTQGWGEPQPETQAEAATTEAGRTPQTDGPSIEDPSLDQRVQAMQDRLDRLQRQRPGRSLER